MPQGKNIGKNGNLQNKFWTLKNAFGAHRLTC